MAKVWNSLPGPRLTFPEDKFKVKYCYHTKKEREPIVRWEYAGTHLARQIPVEPLVCKHCGFPYPGYYD